jgi:hypothetical protein
MKLSAILTAKSEVAEEIEHQIERCKNEIKENQECYEDSVAPDWILKNNEQNELKIKYYESLLKSVPGLN